MNRPHIPACLRRVLDCSAGYRYYPLGVALIAFVSTATFAFPFVMVLITAVLNAHRRWLVLGLHRQRYGSRRAGRTIPLLWSGAGLLALSGMGRIGKLTIGQRLAGELRPVCPDDHRRLSPAANASIVFLFARQPLSLWCADRCRYRQNGEIRLSGVGHYPLSDTFYGLSLNN